MKHIKGLCFIGIAFLSLSFAGTGEWLKIGLIIADALIMLKD